MLALYLPCRYNATSCVASLAVLAVGAADFMAVCAAAAKRQAAILCHETGTRIAPGVNGEALNAALTAFLDARRRSDNIGERWKPGAAASAKKRSEDAQRRAELIREDWAKREIPTAELLHRAGRKIGRRRDIVPMSYTKAAELLGKRPDAQRKRDIDIKREARRKEALSRDEQD